MSGTDPILDAAELSRLEALAFRSGDEAPYGLTAERGFVPKPYPRLLAEGFAAARAIFGEDVDLARGAVLRKLIELSAIGHARTHALLAGIVDDSTIATARGTALSLLGLEVGLARPYLRASGTLRLTVAVDIAADLTLPRGARLQSSGGHHVATLETVTFTPAAKVAEVRIEAALPGPDHNLDPARAEQKVALWNGADPKLWVLRGLLDPAAGTDTLEKVVSIEQNAALSGGELQWPDDRYRAFLLDAPRSIWTPEAIRFAVALVPGVRQVTVRDEFGGLDLDRAIFGNFNFIERLFGAERDLASPYATTILVAPEDGAIWDGPGGLRERILTAIDDVRPVGIFPKIEVGRQIFVGIEARITVRGLPLPSGNAAAVNASQPAMALKAALLQKIAAYVGGLGFGDPVRSAKIAWILMNDPAIVDVQDLRILRSTVTSLETPSIVRLDEGDNLAVDPGAIAVFLDDARWLAVS